MISNIAKKFAIAYFHLAWSAAMAYDYFGTPIVKVSFSFVISAGTYANCTDTIRAERYKLISLLIRYVYVYLE